MRDWEPLLMKKGDVSHSVLGYKSVYLSFLSRGFPMKKLTKMIQLCLN